MLLLALKLSISTLILAVGMTASTGDILYLWWRPLLMLKSILAMYVVIPVVAVLMANFFNLPQKTELAIVILSICAGAPLLPKKLIKFGGDPEYVFSLIVTTSLCSIVTVPISLYVLASLLPSGLFGVTPAQVSWVILKTFLLPLGIGMLLRLLLPDIVEKVGDPLLNVANIAFGLTAIATLIAGFHRVFEVGFLSVVAFALFTFMAILTGHLLGGPTRSTRSSLAVACASRHIGLALLIAANVRGQHALSLVIAYLFASAIVSACYILCLKKFPRQS